MEPVTISCTLDNGQTISLQKDDQGAFSLVCINGETTVIFPVNTTKINKVRTMIILATQAVAQ